MRCQLTRREWLSTLSATAASGLVPPAARADDLPSSPVAVARLKTYGDELQPALATMFQQLGGLATLVSGKVVAIKLNLVSTPWATVAGAPPGLAQWVHPAVITAVVRLLGQAGASRIRLLECCNDSLDSFEDFVREAGWDPDEFRNAAPVVEFENTNGVGTGTGYPRVMCPKGGYIFSGYDLNHSYVDCDFLVSLAKMKEHQWFGVTLSMKNLYGMTPMTIYGDTAGGDQPATTIKGTRVRVMHQGTLTPAKTAPQELDPTSPRAGDYRLPRIIADIVSARPVNLAIIDGIESMAGGEGPWCPDARRVSPGLLVAGLNPVTTDAVAMALMGFDPTADRGTAPFEGCDSFLRFAEELGLGTRDLKRIQVLGASIEEARFDFRSAGWSAPAVTSGGVVNAASYAGGAAVAPGSIASVFGTFFLSAVESAPSFPLPTSLSAMSLRLGDTPLPLFYVSSGQAAFQVPWEMAGQSETSLVAVVHGQASAPETVKLAPCAPGIFTTNARGSGQGAIVDAQNRLADELNPAAPASVIVIYCTGLGAVTDPPQTGAAASLTTLSRTATEPTVTIGGIVAPVEFSGLSPGNVGLYQVNVRVPAGVTYGAAVPVVISMGSVNSNTATIAIGPAASASLGRPEPLRLPFFPDWFCRAG